MTLADARSAFAAGSVLVVPDDEARTAAALLALGRWAHRFSPRVALDPPDGLLLDITGCARTLGGEEAMLRDALNSLRRFGVRASCVIAPTFSAASALARHGGQKIVGEDALRNAIEPLPVSALGLDPKQISALTEVGLERIGQLIDLPRSVLPARFGDDLLLRLDRMLGRAIETIVPLRPEQPIRAALAFDGPTRHTESIEAVVRSLLNDLCEQLASRSLGTLRLILTLTRSDLQPVSLALITSRPTCDAAHLWSLIRPRLERVQMGFGVEGADLLAECCGRIEQTQGSAWSSGAGTMHDPEAFTRLVDGLTNRLGKDRVLRSHAVESHRPERAVSYRPAAEGDAAPAQRDHPPDRPSLLLDEPEEATVIALTPDGPVHRLHWRGVASEILTCIGPERIGPEWWRVSRRRARTRDYFTLQTDTGQWLWACRELDTGRWFIHGMWG